MCKTYGIQSSEKMSTIRQPETAQNFILESLFSHFQLRLRSPIAMHGPACTSTVHSVGCYCVHENSPNRWFLAQFKLLNTNGHLPKNFWWFDAIFCRCWAYQKQLILCGSCPPFFTLAVYRLRYCFWQEHWQKPGLFFFQHFSGLYLRHVWTDFNQTWSQAPPPGGTQAHMTWMGSEVI